MSPTEGTAIRRSPFDLARRIAARVGRMLYRRKELVLYRAPLSGVRQEPALLEPGWRYECRRLTIDEARAFRQAPSDVLARLRPYIAEEIPGQHLLLVLINGEVAGWCIVFVGQRDWPLSETETTLPLQPTDAIFISAYTLPRFRGHHLNRALMGETARVAESLGATHLWAWHEHWNEAPRKNMLHVGMTRVGTHECRWILGLKFGPHINVSVDD